MKISIGLKKTTAADCKIIINITDTVKGERKRKQIATPFKSTIENWDKLKSEPKKTHPQFSVVITYILGIKFKISEVYAKNYTGFDKIEQHLLTAKGDNQDIIEFGFKLIKEKKYSTAKLYESSLNEFRKIHPVLTYEQFDYNAIIKFKNESLKRGLRPASVHSYFRSIRSVYNEYCRRYDKENIKPFEGALTGLKTRSSRAKKNYLEKKQFRKLEQGELSGNKKLARDLWLLQYYLGGQDLIDIVYLEKSDYHNGRAVFKRKKLGNGYYLDNKAFKKAQTIINRYKGTDETKLFDWRTDPVGYATFRDRLATNLKKVQIELKVKVANGGNLGIKTARHTFANFGKRLFIEPDLLRELMGHERSDIDNYYKDTFPEKTRDKAHKKILQYTIKKKKKSE